VSPCLLFRNWDHFCDLFLCPSLVSPPPRQTPLFLYSSHWCYPFHCITFLSHSLCLCVSLSPFPSVHQPNGSILPGMGYGQQLLKVYHSINKRAAFMYNNNTLRTSPLPHCCLIVASHVALTTWSLTLGCSRWRWKRWKALSSLAFLKLCVVSQRYKHPFLFSIQNKVKLFMAISSRVKALLSESSCVLKGMFQILRNVHFPFLPRWEGKCRHAYVSGYLNLEWRLETGGSLTKYTTQRS